MGFKTNSTSPEWMAAPNNSAVALFDGEWHHTASVYDGAQKVIYLDSKEIMRGAATGRIGIGEGDGRVLLGGGRDVDPMVLELGGLIDEARIYDRALTQEEIVAVMENIESFPYAASPNPPVGTILTDIWVNLSWRAGDFAVSHNVYLGDNYDAVNTDDATGGTFRGNQTGTFYVAGFSGYAYPEGLVPGTTYYWRIDEVNDAEPNSPWKGDVWSFSVAPRTAYNPVPADGTEFVVLDNVTLTWTPGFGAKLHHVYFGTNLADVEAGAPVAYKGPTGVARFTPGKLESEKVYYWRVDEFDGAATHKGDIWGFTTPGAAGNPKPAKSAMGVQMVAKLNWTPAATAFSHDIYFGTDKAAVRNAAKASPEFKGNKTKGSEAYDPGKLAWYTPYYWRVDTVYSTGTVKGLIWSFTTADFITVDDFEGYNASDNQIWWAWKDGLGYAAHDTAPAYPGNGTGAAVGDETTPSYTEQTIVHGGRQSMPLGYDSNKQGYAKYSEVERTLVYPRDWTEEGVGQLSLWFRGASANAAERMYVALNGSAVVYHDDPAATQTGRWTEWVIDLQVFQSVNLTNVNTITIGFGTKNSPAAGGSGKMYFDDIRLYRP